MVLIRRLQERDSADWRRLRCALWPRAASEQIDEEMAELRAHPETMPVFVAERPQGGLCGLVEVALRETAEGCTTTPVGYLEAWFVDPEWRGRGIGRQLVAAAEAWAAEQGCTEMASDTSQEYPLSPAAHAHAGYQEVRRDMYFRKALGTGT
jgi:aminoglycoside 6'-N-acetyltransferase I